MKFDPFKFSEVKPNEEIESPQGLLHVMCSQSANFYVTCQGVEVLAGFGQEIRIRIAGAFSFRVEVADDARVFVEDPRKIFFEPSGEVFTNLDRKPMESGTLYEIQKGMRAMRLEHTQLMREMREASVRKPVTVKPGPEPEPAEPPVAEQETPAPEPSEVKPDDA